MADAVVLKEFLIALGVKIDESGQRRFTDSIQSMTSAVVRLGEGFAGVVAGFVAGVAKMADSSEDLKYLSVRIGDSVSNIDAMAFALSKLGVSPQEAIGNLTKLGDTMRNNPGLRSLWEAYAGTGSPTQQINRFSEFLRGISNPEQLRILHEQFSGVFSEDFWQAMLAQAYKLVSNNSTSRSASSTLIPIASPSSPSSSRMPCVICPST